MAALSQALADSPKTILQKVVETALPMFQGGSAGISLLSKENDGKTFYWPAIAGAWTSYVGGGTPREFGPCGVVLDRDAVQLFAHPERYFPYLNVSPPIQEALLAPFYVEGKAVGTVWVITHDEHRKFDAEDVRQLVSLSRFAAAAYKVWLSLDAAEAANRAKDTFLAVLSHELRTPLTPVIMTVAALESNADLPPAIRDDVQMIRRNVELEVKLIDDLLDLSRITSGKLRLQFDLLDANELMRHVCDMCRSNISERGIQLHCDLDENANNVVGDPARLQQVFWNLLKNATKFTPEGGDIYVTVENTDDGQVRATVRDTGIGMAPEILPHVFDAFEQGDPRITRQFGGMGLGLAISKLLVEQHRGSIRAASAGPNQGSTFVVELPSLSQEEAARTSSNSLPGKAAAVRSLRILVVEDHRDTAAALGRLLTASGHAVKTATTAADALALSSRNTFDIVISDLGLPDTTGYELMKQIKERYGTRGIAMSGYGMEEDVRKSERAGFSDHLIKPVSMTQLEQSIRRVAASSDSPR